MAGEPEYKFLPRPDNASSMSPLDARTLFRRNGYYGTTAGFCVGYAQTNLVVLPKELADDFELYCKKNSGPLPLLYRSGIGEVSAPPLASDSHVRWDPPPQKKNVVSPQLVPSQTSRVQYTLHSGLVLLTQHELFASDYGKRLQNV